MYVHTMIFFFFCFDLMVHVSCSLPDRQPLMVCSHLTAVFSMLTRDDWFSLGSSFSCSGTEPLGIIVTGFLRAGCPSCHPIISVKAVKRTQSTNPKQWYDLIHPSYATGLLMEEALLPLFWLSDASS